ncbi:MAG: hypothetical protein KF878_29025 [Planctomycetes bacterium]|nr:hypothetical protein [Planctomycetota bacterium]
MRLHVALALLLLAAPAAAQQQPGGGQAANAQLSTRDLERVAYSLRRLGNFTAAGAAFEQLLEALPKGPEKRLVGLEAAELFRVAGRLDRALILYRRHHDFEGEFEVLFELGRVEEALTVARLVRQPKAEAQALGRLGKVDEALRILEERGLGRERAELLLRSGRHAEAARAFGELGDLYAQGLALEAGGNAAAARRAFEDARDPIMLDLRHEWLPKVTQAEEVLRRAPDAIARERARMRLAKALGAVSEQYERLALVYARTGQAQNQTVTLAQNAKRFAERQRDTLIDGEGAAADEYGKRAVTYFKLPERIALLEQRIREYGQAAPPAPPGPGATPPQPPRRR